MLARLQQHAGAPAAAARRRHSHILFLLPKAKQLSNDWIDGSFERGDAVVVRGPDGHEIGRGLIAYDANDADTIKGRSSANILSILGFTGRTEMIHRDDLVLGGE